VAYVESNALTLTGNQKGRSLADLSQSAVATAPTEAYSIDRATSGAAPGERRSRWSTLASSNTSSSAGASGEGSTGDGADGSSGGGGGFAGLPMPRSKASWGSAPWSRQERETWNNVLKRLRELAQYQVATETVETEVFGSSSSSNSSSSVATAGVTAAQECAGENNKAEEEEQQPTSKGGNLLSLRQDLDARLDILAGLTLPNHTISPSEVGTMVTALVALAPANSAPLAARVCRFIIL